MILKRRLQKSTQTNQEMKNIIMVLALKAFLCPCYGGSELRMIVDTIVKPEFKKIPEGVQFIYRNNVRVKMDEEIYDQVWYSIDILGKLKCYTFSGGLYFFTTKSGEYLLVETDFRRINFGTESFREMNWKELVEIKTEKWRASNCHKLRVQRNSLRKNFVFERQHVKISLIGVKKEDTERWKQKMTELKVLN